MDTELTLVWIKVPKGAYMHATTALALLCSLELLLYLFVCNVEGYHNFTSFFSPLF